MNNELWRAYCQIYEKCRKAKESGKHHINIQFTRDRGYRLMASKSEGRENCCLLDGFGPADWASNVMYRLGDLKFFDAREIDALFDELERVGYRNQILLEAQ